MRGSRWEGKAKTGTQHGNDLPGASIQVGYICHFSTYLLIPLPCSQKLVWELREGEGEQQFEQGRCSSLNHIFLKGTEGGGREDGYY